MALNVNTVTIIGNLAADPEYVERGEHEFCDLRVAVNHGRKNGDGSEKPAYFFDVKTFGKTAGNCRDYLAKGRKVAVLGELRQETWENAEGQKRSKVVIAARQVEFLTPKGDGNGNGGAPTAQAELVPAAPTGDDDIPF